MKEIKLTQGQVALVDDSLFDYLNQTKWYAEWRLDRKSYVAARHSKTLFGKSTKIYMHAIIMHTPKGAQTDHRNHDTLDNRKQNLRICTNAQNQHNSGKHSDNTSGYKGVRKSGRKWRTEIRINGEYRYLGTFDTRELAAHAYDEAAKRLHGEYAILNFQKQK